MLPCPCQQHGIIGGAKELEFVWVEIESKRICQQLAAVQEHINRPSWLCKTTPGTSRFSESMRDLVHEEVIALVILITSDGSLLLNARNPRECPLTFTIPQLHKPAVTCTVISEDVDSCRLGFGPPGFELHGASPGPGSRSPDYLEVPKPGIRQPKLFNPNLTAHDRTMDNNNCPVFRHADYKGTPSKS